MSHNTVHSSSSVYDYLTVTGLEYYINYPNKLKSYNSEYVVEYLKKQKIKFMEEKNIEILKISDDYINKMDSNDIMKYHKMGAAIYSIHSVLFEEEFTAADTANFYESVVRLATNIARKNLRELADKNGNENENKDQEAISENIILDMLNHDTTTINKVNPILPEIVDIVFENFFDVMKYATYNYQSLQNNAISNFLVMNADEIQHAANEVMDAVAFFNPEIKLENAVLVEIANGLQFYNSVVTYAAQWYIDHPDILKLDNNIKTLSLLNKITSKNVYEENTLQDSLSLSSLLKDDIDFLINNNFYFISHEEY